MKLSDLKAFFNDRYAVFELDVQTPALFQEGDLITINNNEYCTVATSIENGGERKECRARFKTAQYANVYDANAAHSICRIKEISGTVLLVEMLSNAERILYDELFPEGFSIAVVDEAVKGIAVSELDNKIKQDYTVFLGKNSYFLVGKFLESRDNDSFILVNPLEKNYFSVVTKNLSDLQLDSNVATDSKKILVIEKREQRLCNFSSYHFLLFRGKISFVDKTERAQLKAGALSWTANGGAKYVKIWDKYAEQEMRLTSEKFDKAGILKFSSVRVDEHGDLVFSIENSAKVFEFKKEVEESFAGQIEIVNSREKVIGTGKIKLKAGNRDEITVESDREIYGSGSLRPNMCGSRVIYERRKRAADAILKADAVNPWIGALLDGEKPSFVDRKPPDRLELDEQIMKKFFPHGANNQQRNAVRSAINTPDIAIIQGPPGTGKTCVIRAIFSHLQKYGKVKDESGKLLVTAYQNDATANAVKEMEDGFGLPVFLYTRDDAAENLRQLELWCGQRVEAVKSHSGLALKRMEQERIRQLEFVCRVFDEPCTFGRAIEVLNGFLQEVRGYFSAAGSQFGAVELSEKIRPCLRKIESLLRRFEKRLNSSEEGRLKYYISRLPTSVSEISDGSELVKNMLDFIASDEYYCLLLREEVERFKAVIKKIDLQKEDYKELKAIKVAMALKLKQKEKLSDSDCVEVSAETKKIVLLLNDNRLKKKDEILLDYIDEMQPTEELQQTIKLYQTINAATHQRTLSSDLFSGDKLPKFKTILVDEAARSCPCDLMIPLACAEEKIVLVGDERQLPQFLDATTVASLADELNKDELEDFKKDLSGESGDKKSIFSVSMFEYLIAKVAKKFTQRDEHGRERVVMLEEQYRMPPVLGRFVSEQFYEGKLKNGSDTLADGTVPERFKQNFPVIGGANMIWLDVPKNGNAEKKSKHNSYWRQGEIDAIFDILDRMKEQFIKENENKSEKDKATIGIITGYSEQRSRIEEQLSDDKWSSLKKYIEIGTIDSFQGKEFDIVFLSGVRTERYGFLSIKDQDNDDFKLSRAGKQRTCVAFSRAKKCMIVVWDAGMVSGGREKTAKEEVPSFVEFYKYCCEETGGVCKIIKAEDLNRGHAD